MTLDAWLEAARALALVEGALEMGLLDALHSKARTQSALARALRRAPAVVEAYLGALGALGVVAKTGAAYRLREEWTSLLRSDAPLKVRDLLEGQHASRGQLRAPGVRGVEAPLAVARGVWGAPDSTEALELFARLDERMPEVRERWRDGAHHVEFGCGLGRHFLRIPVMYPRVTASGIEQNRSVAAAARREVRRLELASRVRIHCADATQVRLSQRAETAFFSQMFFAGRARTEALRRLYALVKPSGFLLVPLPHDDVLQRALYAARGFPLVSERTLEAEVTRAGFRLRRRLSFLSLTYLVFERRPR